MMQKLSVAGMYVGLWGIPLLALTGSALAQKSHPPQAPPAGQGLIYIYRQPRYLGKDGYPSIFVNDYFLGELQNGEYVSLAVKEGPAVVTASAPTTRWHENPYNSRVKPPSTAGYWASIPGCAVLDWGRLALASPDNVGLCLKNLVQLYVECGASSRTVETLGTGETRGVRIPVCNHRLDGSETAFHLLFLAQWTKRVNIDVQAGKTYYVEWTADNIVYNTKSFDLVDEATGAAAVSKYKPAKER